MRVLLLTNEFPPHIYGGAGVHVEYLSRELAHLTPIEVRSFHEQEYENGQLRVRGTKIDPAQFAECPKQLVSPLKALATCIAFNGQGGDADVVHCHTWYAHFGGILAKQLYGIPLVITVHSLEPHRPWKREQIGRGYDVSSWIEKTALEMADAVIAVSSSTRDDILEEFNVSPDVLHVVPNGVDTDEYRAVESPDILARFGINPDQPFVLFVGRVTRQKGLTYLLQAADKVDPGIQLVFCAGESDTPELQAETERMVAELQATRPGIHWIDEMVDRETIIGLYSHASIFCCPSVYEPFGIINLEAMACGTPVVGSRIGGIPEVVVDGETGILVDLEIDESQQPRDPEAFSSGLAAAINRLAGDPDLCRAMGLAGRQRVEDVFSWRSIAKKTLELYNTLIENKS
jgi:glycogen synthase